MTGRPFFIGLTVRLRVLLARRSNVGVMAGVVTPRPVPTDAARGSTFRSLRTRNYRLYFSGQLISMAGTFMQTVAQGWLVLKLTGSTTALGLVLAVQYVPMLLLGPFGGVLVDRADRRKLWMLTQTLAGLCALTLGLLTVTGAIRLWMVFGLATALGIVTSIDQTTKIALIP